MNRLVIILVSLIASTFSSCAATLPELVVTVIVVSEDGTPIPDAKVGVGFQPLGIKGSGKKGTTNENGVFKAKGKSNLQLRVNVSKDGYYPSTLKNIGVSRGDSPNQFIPEDKEVPIVLRKIVNPQAMYAKTVYLEFPENGKKFGFDLELGDWVAPHGNGVKADMFFSADGFYNDTNDHKATLQLTFPNPKDGVQLFETPWRVSEFISPYEAPLAGYLPEFVGTKGDHINTEGDFKCVNTIDRSEIILFRVRSEVDASGNIIAAQYGKIYDGFTFVGGANNSNYGIKFTYYLNPNVNDRNLEYDVSGNLISNLGNGERVYAP